MQKNFSEKMPLVHKSLLTTTLWEMQCSSKGSPKYIRFTNHQIQVQISAYLLGYKSIAVQGDKTSFIDIPKTAGTSKFLFIRELAGCSLIVTDYNASNYRVSNGSWPLSLALYKKVVIAADLTDYIGGLEVDPNEFLLTVCLQYKTSHKQWWLFAQILKEDGNSQHWRIFCPSQSQLLPSFFIRRTRDYKVPAIKDLWLKI